MPIPLNLLTLYNDTCEMFADLVPKYCSGEDCKVKNTDSFNDAFHFLTAGDYVLDAGDAVAFESNLNAANKLLISINLC